MTGLYRRYIRQYSDIARPLTPLTRKNTQFVWSDEAQEAFDILKEYLTQAAILVYPDVRLPYKLYTDARQYTIGAILTQEKNGQEHVIQYISTILNNYNDFMHYIYPHVQAIVMTHVPTQCTLTSPLKHSKLFVQSSALLLQ